MEFRTLFYPPSIQKQVFENELNSKEGMALVLVCNYNSIDLIELRGRTGVNSIELNTILKKLQLKKLVKINSKVVKLIPKNNYNLTTEITNINTIEKSNSCQPLIPPVKSGVPNGMHTIKKFDVRERAIVPLFLRGGPGGESVFATPEENLWNSMGGKLAIAISKKHKINKNVKVEKWGAQFKRLNSIDGVSITRIEKTIDWYCQTIEEHDQYIPVVESGSSFRKKFIRVEMAMKRWNKDKPQKIELDKRGKKLKSIFKKTINGSFEYDPKELPVFIQQFQAWEAKVNDIHIKNYKNKTQRWIEDMDELLSKVSTLSLYLKFIQDTTQGWKWGVGSLLKNFSFGGKYFQKYIDNTIAEFGFQNGAIPSKIREILRNNETNKD